MFLGFTPIYSQKRQETVQEKLVPERMSDVKVSSDRGIRPCCRQVASHNVRGQGRGNFEARNNFGGVGSSCLRYYA